MRKEFIMASLDEPLAFKNQSVTPLFTVQFCLISSGQNMRQIAKTFFCCTELTFSRACELIHTENKLTKFTLLRNSNK